MQSCPPVHPTPQPPQFIVVVIEVSQPFAAVPSQSAKPALQAPRAQEPAVQRAVALGYEHTRPHIPQLLTVPRLVSQPLAGSPSQSPKPLLHVKLHRPAAHEDTALGRAGHAFAQAPQWLTLALVSTQLEPHKVCEPGQVSTHDPVAALHVGVDAGQRTPQAPQFIAVSSDVSQPSPAAPLQSPKFRLHAYWH